MNKAAAKKLLYSVDYETNSLSKQWTTIEKVDAIRQAYSRREADTSWKAWKNTKIVVDSDKHLYSDHKQDLERLRRYVASKGNKVWGDYTSEWITTTPATDSWLDFNGQASDFTNEVMSAYKEHLQEKSSFRSRVKANLLIKVRSRHDPLRQNCTPQEMQARLLLRDLLSEKEWRRYVTNGFIMVEGQSNRWYQIFHDQRRIAVYESGQKTHTLCIHTAKECPPTDHLINLKAMIEIDERQVWELSNSRDLGRDTSIPNLWDTAWIQEVMRRHA